MSLKDLSKIQKEQDEKIRSDARKDLEVLLEEEPARFSGFAFVFLHQDGRIGTAIRIYNGPIGRTLMPAVVHDALLKHIAIDFTKEELEDENRIPK